jgi:hypothetical protein
MEQLFEGRTPAKETLDAAPMLNWWRVGRLPGRGLYISGVYGIRPPANGATEQMTGIICWMDFKLRWCRCDDGWWRLGPYETEIPMDLEDFG